MNQSESLDAIFRCEIEGEIVLELQEELYSREAILRTCYWFTDRCYLFLAVPNPGLVRVHLRTKHHRVPSLQAPQVEGVAVLVGEFANALLDNQFRLQISAKTAGVRELIVARALAEMHALDPIPGGLREPAGTRQDSESEP